MDKNNEAWTKIFAKYDVLNKINADGIFQISAEQIKEFREPRLMAKFDHFAELPKIFRDNNLSILPISRGDYVIGYFNAYHNLERNTSKIIEVELPSHIQSLNSDNIFSESVALNCAFVSNIISNFMEDDAVVPTVSGRMTSGEFNFNIADSRGGKNYSLCVKKAQIEIDAAYEGVNSLAIIEAKRDLKLSDDFIIRQLYYPYRTWMDRIYKPIKPIFAVYLNGVYEFYEFNFTDPNNYTRETATLFH